MKYVMIGVMAACVLLLNGCAKKQTQTIIFDEYSIPLATQEIYTKILSNKNEIVQQFKGEHEGSGTFVSSLLIAKASSLDFSGEDIIKQILNNEIRSISKAEIKKQDTIDLSCTQDGKTYLASSEIHTTKDPLYLTQEIIIQTGNIYIVSHMTKNKTEKNNIRDSFKKITCLQ